MLILAGHEPFAKSSARDDYHSYHDKYNHYPPSSTTTPRGPSSTTSRGPSSTTSPRGPSSTTSPRGPSSTTSPRGPSTSTTPRGSSSITSSARAASGFASSPNATNPATEVVPFYEQVKLLNPHYGFVTKGRNL